MWFITLLVLALAAFFIVKSIKAQSLRQAAEQRRLTDGSGVAGNLGHTAPVSSSSTSVSEKIEESEPASQPHPALNSEDSLHDIREMIKILNLAESDASRLGISATAFAALRGTGNANDLPTDSLDSVADRLRKMLA